MGCDGHRRVRTTHVYSCFLTADSSQEKHKKICHLPETKYFFPIALAFLQNKRLSIPKVNLGNAAFDSDWQLASWLQPPGIGAEKERKRNYLEGEESGCRERKKTHGVIQCTLPGKEGSDAISPDRRKRGCRLTRQELGFTASETGNGPWEELIKEEGGWRRKFAKQVAGWRRGPWEFL